MIEEPVNVEQKRGRGRPKGSKYADPIEARRAYGRKYHDTHKEKISEYMKGYYLRTNDVLPKRRCEYVGPRIGQCPKNARGENHYCACHIKYWKEPTQ